MAEDQSFADAPVSLAERRAEEQGDCDLWTPREMLIALLRAIDSGDLSADGMVVIWKRTVDTKHVFTAARRAKLGIIETIGLLDIAKRDFLEP